MIGTLTALNLNGIFPIGPTTALADGTMVSLDFKLDLNQMFPANGFIQVIIPDDFTIDPTISFTDCQVHNQVGGYVNSANCILSGMTIKITNVNINWQVGSGFERFRIYNRVYKPNYNITALFDIGLYDIDGVRLL